ESGECTQTGSVHALQNGTYTQTLRAPLMVGNGVAKVVGKVEGVSLLSAPAELRLVANSFDKSRSTITSEASSIVANGQDETTVTVTFLDYLDNQVKEGGKS